MAILLIRRQTEKSAFSGRNMVYDLIILDRMLPKRDGIAVLKELREEGSETPVIFLTAKDASKDRVEGLDAGAEIIWLNHLHRRIVSRLRSLTRRKNKQLTDNKIRAAD
jgi:DNA-binding response OmpR family regulator